ncbi:MAG: hypothetical protein ACE5MG_07585 [Candidatus Methylomirabilales bacterium]
MKWNERLRVKLKRSTLVWAVPLAVAGLIVALIAVNWGTTEHKKGTNVDLTTVDRITVDSCKQIRLGMTKDQVLNIMPEPVGIVSYTRNGREKEKLLFPSPAAASTPPQFVIDGRTGQVEEGVCDENYRLSQR